MQKTKQYRGQQGVIGVFNTKCRGPVPVSLRAIYTRTDIYIPDAHDMVLIIQPFTDDANV
jgi:hypothetical protein